MRTALPFALVSIAGALAACGGDSSPSPDTAVTTTEDTAVAPDADGDTGSPTTTPPADTSGCTPGSLGCACKADDSCNGSLVCRAGDKLCAAPTGYSGGPCNLDGTCDSGNVCDDGLCSPCLAGTPGCDCGAGNTCSGGYECDPSNSRCADPSTIVAHIPTTPKCYTHCSAGYLDGSTWRACGGDGLMDGCVGDRSCTDGSCLEAGEAVPTCAGDIDCPDHQACMQGHCYSNCDANRDCGAGTVCYLHVCRTPCDGQAGDCADGTACDLVVSGTTSGYCMPTKAADGGTTSPLATVGGGFTVSPQSFDLSNIETAVRLTLTNNTQALVTFRVRKLEHHLNKADGTSESLFDFDDDDDCDPLSTCPLYWLEMGAVGVDPAKVTELSVTVDPMSSADVRLQNAAGVEATSWTGSLQIVSPLGKAEVNLTYAERLDGQWKGTAFYYTSWNDEGLADWSKNETNRSSETKQELLRNAFVERWVAFRSGDRGVSWDEMQAVMTSTQSGSWKSASEDPECSFDVCYLYDGEASGLGGYSSDANRDPVPTGVTELPFAMNLMQSAADPTKLVGRIESASTLHYAGNPAVTLQLGDDHDACSFSDDHGVCVLRVSDFSASIPVGGRYITSDSDTSCASRAGQGFQPFRTPWLLPGFARATYTDAESSLLYRYECRDSRLPFDSTAAGAAGTANITSNLSLAQSNPIPDGRARKRSLQLLDGALVNQTTMVILFKEHMASFLDPSDTDGLDAYGYIVLTKQAADLGTDDDDHDGIYNSFEGQSVTDTRSERQDLLQVQCSDEILYDTGILAPGEVLSAGTAPRVVSALVTGVASTSTPTALTTASSEQVHYYCEDTGLFDGGPKNTTKHGIVLTTGGTCGKSGNTTYFNNNGACEDGGPNSVAVEDGTASRCALGTDAADCGTRYTADKDVRVACPAGSRVIFFTVNESTKSQADIANESCQDDGTCFGTLQDWIASGIVVNQEPHYECATGGAYCDLNRQDLRDGKTFYAVADTESVMPSFRAGLEQAFRYRVRFRSRTGAQVGFAPDLCEASSDQVPYCYDPPTIEQLRERSDCLLSIWDDYYLDLVDAGQTTTLDTLDEFLSFDFSQEEGCQNGDPNRCTTYDGFERLYAELLIMMGDESYTKAFSSRFDLAATNTKSFEGSLFEDGGINLSGVAGFEMYNLYQATQYYSEALDRFYSLSPMVWLALEEDHAEQVKPADDHRASFVTPAMVTTYMERLLRASTQKARAFSEIAKKYQSFNRSDLARSVIERAYTATYLESVALSQVMTKIRDSFSASQRPQIETVLEDGQRRYRMAMLDMRTVYNSITDDTTIFGIDPDYIPFPTLNDTINDENAFQKLLARAWQREQIAKAREDVALESNRSFDTDAALFQSELTQIRTTYESQLGDVCGTFSVDVGNQTRVYPATRKYADLDPKLAVLGDPCGMVGNGQLYQAMVQIDVASTDLQLNLTRYANTIQQIQNEKDRVDAQCTLIKGNAAFLLCTEIGKDCSNVPDDAPDLGDDVLTIENRIRAMRTTSQEAQRTLDQVRSLAEFAKCSALDGECATAIAASTVYTVAATVNEGLQIGTATAIAVLEGDIDKRRSKIAAWQTERQCDALSIDSAARVKDLYLETLEIDLETLRTEYQLQLALSEIERLHNVATRLQLEQEESEQMAINVQAAKDDPNVRIYKNDAVINADIAFDDALQQAYKATRVYEYYTSQSYAARDQLYLIRMVSSGDYNLENYLVSLENSFIEFEEEYGEADLRVQVISLMNDIFKIPKTDPSGADYSQGDRITMLRQRLADTSLLDENGYISIPFTTSIDDLSPLTRDHKIDYLVVDLNLNSYGDDDVARVYLRQKGTSVVHAIDGSTQYYRFPERTAVVDVMMNGNRDLLDPAILKSYRFRDRPYANTGWELVLNQRDEPVNRDLDLTTVNDIKIYLYYTDFTTF
ncbi:MAG: hypothetical protein U1F43_21220 [Myxococcota bacterium]